MAMVLFVPVQVNRREISPRISADFEILGGKKNLECIKTAVFDTRNPKSPYRGRGFRTPLPHTPPSRSTRSLAKLSSSFFKYFLSQTLTEGLTTHNNRKFIQFVI